MTAHRLERLSWPAAATVIGCAVAATGLALLAQFGDLPAGDRPGSTPFPGFTADEMLPPGKGLVVTSLRSGSEAQHAGIEVGDTVVALGRQPLGTLIDAENAVGKASGSHLVLHLLHKDEPRVVVLRRT